MKPLRLVWYCSAIGAICIHLSVWGQAKEKPIRLRNEVILTQTRDIGGGLAGGPENRPATKPAKHVASGLFLIQFEAVLQPEWRELLRGVGVDLVRHVPEDAFIAKLENVPVERLRALPFVQWVGEYRPEHKVHAAVNKAAQGKAEDLWVSVLFSPLATAAEKAQGRRAFGRIHQESHLRAGDILRGTIPKGQLEKLAESAGVLWIEPGPKIKLYDEISSKIVAGNGGWHATYTQINGYDGTGVAVAVADSGLDTGEADTMHPDLYGRATNFFYYGELEDASDEHSHGTHVSGIIAGNGAVGEVDETDALYGLGVAPNARIITQRMFDGAGNYEPPPSFGTLTRDAVGAGADIGSNSWGDDTQGRYDTSAMEFDALARDADEFAPGDQPYILEFSAGNAGPWQQTIGSPAVGKNVIATGASQNNRLEFWIYADGQETMADFSSRGPCEDGRIKPDVVAPGTWIASLASSYATGENAWGDISFYYLYMGGTSQAGPHVSGAAAVLVQYYRQNYGRTPSPALVKAALINSAVNMDDEVETGPAPNMDEGWGRIDLTEIIGSERLYQFVEQTNRLRAGQFYEQRVLVGNGEMALKFTLAYTDVPGFPGAIPALVNDLDLEVIGPDGRQYHGNRFLDGESAPNAPDYDNINNVEGVHFNAPMAGEYIVRVRARQVVEDAVQETPGVMDQDFALVISGNLLAPSTSLIVMDRKAYSAPGRIYVKLYDFDLAGQAAVTNLIRSTTEINGEALILRANGISGVFTGSIATVTGFGAVDGRLQVSHGDTIEAIYQDASPAATRIAAAVCDLEPPAILNVTARNRFGQTAVSWDTDEPADGTVLYGTDPQHLHWGVTNTAFRQSHTFTLANVVSGVTNYFLVISSDLAGNTAANDNGGELFSFMPVPAATVLVVDCFNETDWFDVPISTYTAALDQIGIACEVWDATAGPTPALSDLRPYALVIWRPLELTGTLSAADRTALTEYLNGGGSLLMASMETTTRLEEAGASQFRSNVLHIASYTEDQEVDWIVGVTNDPFTRGIDVGLDWTAYEEIFAWFGNFSDYIRPGAGAAPILTDLVSGATVGLRYPATGVNAPGRVVYLSFPLDAIPLEPGNPARAQVLQGLINFLIPGGGGEGIIALDRNAYTLPSVVTIEVADSDLSGQTNIAVDVFSDTDTRGQGVTLVETVRRGVFRGAINLVNATNPPAPGQLRASPGETIRAEYYDASVNETKRASAQVDVVPAVISAVEAYPEYIDAVVTWSTSEGCDSMVQFGKSKLLDRIAYDSELVTEHALLLTGLDAEQTYYYQVISRDEAGNTSLDDNGGQLYSFLTLTPIHPPFTDNFNSPNSQWTVYSSDDSEGGWQLGVPANGRESSAHSPPHAWGSNLRGDPISYVESFLISPPILLSGGNRASLRFWHSYDFTSRSDFDIFEGGTVLIITNENSNPVTLGEFGMDEVSAGWEEASFDLSPYAGQLVYLVWFYQILSFSWEGANEHPGWLLDDVSVTTSNVIPGTLLISNNLWQARFNLSGPLAFSGRGTSLAVSNAPPGRYVLRFNDVPYYQTPPAQTNDLISSGSVLFHGEYVFADVNTNEIADGWEEQFFGTVSPTRTRYTDSDGDQASDYAEFVAGSDPRLASSSLQISGLQLLSNGTMRLQWASARDRAYRVEGSTNGRTWSAISDWIHAQSSTTFYVFPLPGPGGPNWFRVVVRP